MKNTCERMCMPEVPDDLFVADLIAVISPIGWLNIKGEDVQAADGEVGPIAQKLYGMQRGTVEDDMGWTYPLRF